MKKNSKSPMKKEPKAKRAQAQRPVQRETKEVLAELVEKLRGKLELKATSASPAEAGPRAELGPKSGPVDGGSGFGRPMEPLLHFGFARGDAKLRTGVIAFQR